MKGFFTIIQSGRNRESVDIRPELVASVESVRDVSIRWPADTYTLIHLVTGQTYATSLPKGEIVRLMEQAIEHAND